MVVVKEAIQDRIKTNFLSKKKFFLLLDKVCQNNYKSKIFLKYFVGNIHLNLLKSIIPYKLKKIIKYKFYSLTNHTKND